jgi:hypothetical protein
MRRVADRWFWGSWAAWTLAHVVWQGKAPDDYARIWGGTMHVRAPERLFWTVVGIPIFVTGFMLFVAQVWPNYRAGARSERFVTAVGSNSTRITARITFRSPSSARDHKG